MWDGLAQVPVDLVLLDVMLPGVSGVDLCRALREHSDVAIIMLTARRAGAARPPDERDRAAHELSSGGLELRWDLRPVVDDAASRLTVGPRTGGTCIRTEGESRRR
jgi:CheY-like chemotaxis protein